MAIFDEAAARSCQEKHIYGRPGSAAYDASLKGYWRLRHHSNQIRQQVAKTRRE